MVKTGVSLPDELYEKLVSLAQRAGYPSISKAIRDAVELFIAFNTWWSSQGPVTGVLHLLAEAKHGSEIQEALQDAEEVVEAVLYRRLGASYIAVIVVVEGEPGRIKDLYKKLTRLRGVLAVQPALLPAPAAATRGVQG
ncbi:CopG family ribbon-helix-helix protein [Hyperthermus butylicus]|uniref:CopG family ribbon-helix-helix protein n=1 Tax=Hyperthermus butylicus TaxID=54248 RepID=UPI001E63521E|nr:ribbon-helix-helix protein, CopG family [Hyperthermus butylicus]